MQNAEQDRELAEIWLEFAPTFATEKNMNEFAFMLNNAKIPLTETEQQLVKEEQEIAKGVDELRGDMYTGEVLFGKVDDGTMSKQILSQFDQYFRVEPVPGTEEIRIHYLKDDVREVDDLMREALDVRDKLLTRRDELAEVRDTYKNLNYFDFAKSAQGELDNVEKTLQLIDRGIDTDADWLKGAVEKVNPKPEPEPKTDPVPYPNWHN